MKSFAVALFATLALLYSPMAKELDLQEVAARPELWPREVALTAAIPVPLIVDGKNVGTASLPAGTRLALTKVVDDKVQLSFAGSPVLTEAGNTDLRQRIQQALHGQEQRANLTANSTAASVPAPAAALSPVPVLSPIAKALNGSLVSLTNGGLNAFDDSALPKVKYYAVYFSASWCPPCRKFTPELVKFYNALKPKHPEFELVFASWDRSSRDMEKYMQTDSMPWPALRFSLAKTTTGISDLAGRGIPCLVLIDQDGKVLSHSYEGSKYVGPIKVLRDIEAKLGASK